MNQNLDVLWTPPKLVKWIADDFANRGFPEPHRLQAEQLVSYALDISRLDIYLQHDKPCTSEERDSLRKLLKRRYRREPVSYILGSCEFWTLTLNVGQGVLIPRQETEILVESVLAYLPDNNGRNPTLILELGTGCGAIPLSLCAEKSNLTIVTTDHSEKALAYAGMNMKNHGKIIQEKDNCIIPVRTDRFNALKPGFGFDFIISNPPYIGSQEIETLQKEVTDWEPHQALDGGPDGLEFYRYLIQAAVEHLKPSGYLIFEHGFDQASAISKLMSPEKSLHLIEQRRDYSKKDRVMVYQKP